MQEPYRKGTNLKVDRSTIINLERGKIPPQAVDLEKVVIGAMLADTTGADKAIPILKTPDVFYKDAHRAIFTAIFELYTGTGKIDILTVSNKLRQLEMLEVAGGDYYLTGLVQKVASAAHIEYHSRIIMQYYLKRSIIKFNLEITQLAYDDATDVFDLLETWQSEFDNVIDLTLTGRRTLSLNESLSVLKSNVERLSENTEAIPMSGVHTGFKWSDQHTGGYRPGDLVILAARPGMGKTSKVLRTASANLIKNVPVGIISLEMAMNQLTSRLVSMNTGLHINQLIKHGFTKQKYWEEYDNQQKVMEPWPLVVDDNGINDISDIKVLAKAWKRTHKIELLIIDYLQLMDDKTVKSSNREPVISSISRKLKLLAKELDMPIIALSQLSRAVETRGGSKRPQLSDLRESGAIEQDADIVEFLYRPDYYDMDMNIEHYKDQTQQTAVTNGANTEFIFAKYRGGALGTLLIKWVGDKTKFTDDDDYTDDDNIFDD